MSDSHRDYLEQIKKLHQINVSKMMDLGLQQPRLLHEAIGSPANCFKSIHVAGTNGKGSVCYKLSEGLQTQGYKVGLYSSPHISTFRERISINGEMIPEEAVAEGLRKLFATGISATFFEFTTILAFDYFAKNAVDWAVLETGMGGRLDATNIVVPEAAAITSIGYDHCQYLGDTLEQITYEKAGIIKKGVPVIVGPTVPVEYIQDADIHRISGKFLNYERENRAIAAAILDVLRIPYGEEIEKVPPCRFEKRFYKGEEYILDVAHNPQGLERLFERVEQSNPLVICGMSKGKDLRASLAVILKHTNRLAIISGKHARLASLDEMKESCPGESVALYRTVTEAIEKLRGFGGPTIICGSFFIMEEARRALGLQEPADPLDLNERFKTQSFQ